MGVSWTEVWTASAESEHGNDAQIGRRNVADAEWTDSHFSRTCRAYLFLGKLWTVVKFVYCGTDLS